MLHIWRNPPHETEQNNILKGKKPIISPIFFYFLGNQTKGLARETYGNIYRDRNPEPRVRDRWGTDSDPP